jgi:hypothetical protein
MLSLCMHTLSIPFTCVEILTTLIFTLRISNFDMPVSCPRCLNDYCDMCSNLAPVSPNFSSVSTWHFLAGFLFRSDTVDLTLLIGLRILLMLMLVFPRNLQ